MRRIQVGNAGGIRLGDAGRGEKAPHRPYFRINATNWPIFAGLGLSMGTSSAWGSTRWVWGMEASGSAKAA